MRILIAEDEEILAKILKTNLEKSGYNVDYLTNGDEVEKRIISHNKEYDLLILDWLLPSKDGLQICKNIRKLKINLPILMLTARFDTEDKVSALNAGADDYLIKPFSFEELEARIKALLRRPVVSMGEILTTGKLKMDIEKHKVYINDKIIRLTNKEFSLLEYFLRNVDKVIHRDQLLHYLWGFELNTFSNVVDVHIRNLRQKLKIKGHPIIETVRGVGYKIRSL